MTIAKAEKDVIVTPMCKDDIVACAELCYEGFGDLFDRFLLPGITLTPQQWKVKQMEFRIGTMTGLLEEGEQGLVQCKVLRNVTSGEVAGLAMWKVPHHPKDMPNKKSGEAVRYPTLPVEIDAEAWHTFRDGPERYRREEFPGQTVAELLILVIKSSYRNRNLGTILLSAFLESIHGKGAFLSSARRAVPLYQRHGFYITARGIQDGGVPVPSLPGEDQGVENNWPMARPASLVDDYRLCL